MRALHTYDDAFPLADTDPLQAVEGTILSFELCRGPRRRLRPLRVGADVHGRAVDAQLLPRDSVLNMAVLLH